MESGDLNDAEFARELAERAGALLLALRAEGSFSGRALGDEGDRRANQLICAAIHRERPRDGLLSEESTDDGHRLKLSRVWVVDPLDGTREYAEGRDDWAVHIGLSIDGVAAVGAVALPAMGQVLSSESPAPLGTMHHPPRMVVSRSRAPELAMAVAAKLGAELVPMGSAGAKAMAVVRGEAEIYLHAGGQYAWDNCAPAAVALAAGLHASRIDGSALTYNLRDPSIPDLLICRRELAPAAIDEIRQIGWNNQR